MSISPNTTLPVFSLTLGVPDNIASFKALNKLFLSFASANAEDDNEVYKHLTLFGEAFEKIKNAIIKFMIETTNSISLLKKRIDIINGNIDDVDSNTDLIKF